MTVCSQDHVTWELFFWYGVSSDLRLFPKALHGDHPRWLLHVKWPRCLVTAPSSTWLNGFLDYYALSCLPAEFLLSCLREENPCHPQWTDSSETRGLEKPVLADCLTYGHEHLVRLILWPLFLPLSNWQSPLPRASTWFVNKTSLEYMHTHSFISRLWLHTERLDGLTYKDQTTII